MADTKISALPASTTPLAGTEVLPIVQSSSTKQVSVANLTAGRAVAMRDANLTGGTASVNIGATGDNTYHYTRTVDNDGQAVYFGNDDAAGSFFGAGAYGRVIYSEGSKPLKIFVNGAYRADYDATGNYKLNTGNLIQGTAAKGVDFTANTPAAGMTSQLLNWYEEGTWTPNQGGGLTLVGAFSSTGTYTRIGRQVFIRGSVSGATSVAVASAGAISTNLPYSAVAAATGAAINAANTASSVLRVSSATITASTAIAATATITFSAVYSV